MSIYLDHNATTPLDSRVLEVMLPYLQGSFGNPSSNHQWGREAQRAVQHAREQVAMLVGVESSQVVFTSGGTEANNLALKGVMAVADVGSTLVVSAVEHSSILQSAHALELAGYPLAVAAVDGDGVVKAAPFEQAVAKKRVSLAAVMLANNEAGVVQNVAQLSEIAKRHGVVMHTDAVQALGKMVVDFEALGVSLMSISAHKIYGPKGVGALVMERGFELPPLLHGGGHEAGRRAGTENVAGIVGFGAAAALLQSGLAESVAHSGRLRCYAEQALQEIPGIVIFSQQVERLPNTLFFAVSGIEGATLLMNLDREGIAVSSGSACTSGSGEPSHVLQAMGVDNELAYGAVRISFGNGNTIDDVDRLILSLRRQIERLLRLNSGWGSPDVAASSQV